LDDNIFLNHNKKPSGLYTLKHEHNILRKHSSCKNLWCSTHNHIPTTVRQW